MGYKIKMSTGLKLFVFLFINLVAVLPASAQMNEAQLRKEAIYRASLGRADDVRLLLNQGASPDLTNDDGTPLLALAAARKDSEAIPVMKVLLEKGANINAKDKQGRTALFAASQQSIIPNIQFLLDNNINYYAIDNKGDVARTVAFREGRPDIVAIMDNFVKAQSVKVAKQYEEANAALAARYAEQKKQQDEAAAAAAAAATAAAAGTAKPEIAGSGESAKLQGVLKEKQELEAKLSELEAKKAEQDAKATDEALAMEADIRARIELNQKIEEELREQEREAEKLRAAEERKRLQEELKKQEEEQAKAELEEAKRLAEEARKQEQEAIRQQQEAERQAQHNINELGRLSELLAFHSCAFQYWFYCRESKQGGELSREQLDYAIEASKDKVLELTDSIARLNPQPENYADNLSERIKKRIYSRIEEIPTKRLRKQEGIGQRADMEMRCDELSRQWQIVVNSEEPKKNTVKNIGVGAGIGGVGGAGVTPSKNTNATSGTPAVPMESIGSYTDPSNNFVITPEDMRRGRQPPKLYYRPGQ